MSETRTEGDGTVQPACTRPPGLSLLAFVSGFFCLMSLAYGLAGGPDPTDLQTAMILAVVTVIALARGDQVHREGR